MPEPTPHNLLLAKLLQQDPKKEAAYYEELGRFIAAYSSAEAQIHTITRHYAHTQDERARIILGGLRVSDAIDRLRALMRLPDISALGLFGGLTLSEDAQKKAEIVESCLQQFQMIGRQRDKLVHRTIVYYEEIGFNVSNGQTAKSLASAELRLIVTSQDLKNMRLDCGAIYLALAAITGDSEWLRPYEGLLPTWRYTPPKSPQKPKPLPNRSERKRQRRT